VYEVGGPEKARRKLLEGRGGRRKQADEFGGFELKRVSDGKHEG
jgi:hypothetical protein